MIVAWLWQAFRHDLAPIVNGLPYADGRYQAAPLDAFPVARRRGLPGLAGSSQHRAQDAPVGIRR